MKRFVRTFTVRGRAQFTVVDDGLARVVEVLKWVAGESTVSLGYGPSDLDRSQAKSAVVREARRLAGAEPLVGRRAGVPISSSGNNLN